MADPSTEKDPVLVPKKSNCTNSHNEMCKDSDKNTIEEVNKTADNSLDPLERRLTATPNEDRYKGATGTAVLCSMETHHCFVAAPICIENSVMGLVCLALGPDAHKVTEYRCDSSENPGGYIHVVGPLTKAENALEPIRWPEEHAINYTSLE